MTTWNDIDLATVPLIPDFSVELREMEDAGKIVHFVSPRASKKTPRKSSWSHPSR